MRKLLTFLFTLLLVAGSARADSPEYSRKEDVVYGRYPGVALTMDVLTPKKANGVGLILVVSGGWFSSHDTIGAGLMKGFADELLGRGYTIFAVVHASQPKFNIQEIIPQINRSVKFIRFHAKDYGIDPNQIGIYGGSAGGHLTLMQATSGTFPDDSVKDPIEKVSARVQAAACFFPPTDFLNYGAEGRNCMGKGVLEPFQAAFRFVALSPKTNAFEPVTDEKKLEEIGKAISPIYHINKDTPPTLIIHGDADTLVPYEQGARFVEKLRALGVDTKLITMKGAGHGPDDLPKRMKEIGEWFDGHLAGKGQ